MNIYHLMVTDRAPSLAQRKYVFSADSYLEAVEAAQREWRRVQRSVTLHVGEYDIYWYHRIDAQGTAVDRNTNSGVPELARLEAN